MPVPPDCFRCPDFNSRTHVECDQNGVVITTEMEVFQLTHSRGVRLVERKGKNSSLNFNSRTHVECDW